MTRLAYRAGELRATFDASFARPRVAGREAMADLLVVGVGGQSYVVPVREIGALLADRVVTGLPGAGRALLGVAMVRGGIVPVYHLAVLTGHPPLPVPPRWLLVAAGDEPVAFAVDAVAGHVRVARTAARGIVAVGGAPHPVLHLPDLVDGIRARLSGTGGDGP